MTTPNPHQLSDEARKNLLNEWQWMLVAAETWRWMIAHADNAGGVPYTDRLFPLHSQVVAMDSAFLHGRTLYEFFGIAHGEGRLDTDYSVNYGFAKPNSPWWDEWGMALEKRLFHLDVDRSTQGGASDLTPDKLINVNQQVLDMVSDLHALWSDLCSHASVDASTQREFKRIRRKAEGLAANVRDWFRTNPACSTTTPRPPDPLTHHP